MDIDLKKIRKEKDLKMEKVSEATGVSITLISLAENKPESRNIATIEKLANHYGYEVTLKKVCDNED